jgi:hypothetical protein
VEGRGAFLEWWAQTLNSQKLEIAERDTGCVEQDQDFFLGFFLGEEAKERGMLMGATGADPKEGAHSGGSVGCGRGRAGAE